MFHFISDMLDRFKRKLRNKINDKEMPISDGRGKINYDKNYDYSNDYISPTNFLMNRKTTDLIIPDINIRNNVGKKAPTILIIDDFPGMVDLLYTELLRVQCCRISDKFNIITATEEYAAYTVKEYLDHGGKIDIAFLDITIGGIKDGIELDGIDIAIMIKEINPECEIRFITGHTLNKRNPEIFEFMQKFYIQTGIQIDEQEEVLEIKTQEPITIMKHIIGKNGNRLLLMAIAIEQWLIRQNKIDLKTGKCLL